MQVLEANLGVRANCQVPKQHAEKTPERNRKSLTPSPFPKQAATIPIKQRIAPTLEHASNTENLIVRAENSYDKNPADSTTSDRTRSPTIVTILRHLEV